MKELNKIYDGKLIMRNLKSKVKKIENIIKPEKEAVIFVAGGPNRDENFERQMAEYLENGGYKSDLPLKVKTSLKS